MAPTPTHPADRFWPKVRKGAPDECWEWQGARQQTGYGYLQGGALYGKRWAIAHRLSWEIEHGVPVPEGKCVCHHCDNPPCVNPAHLYVGTKADNARDRASRGRGRENRQHGAANANYGKGLPGEANGNAKLTEADVRQIIKALKQLPRRSTAAIGRDFGVSQQTVSNIARRKSWAHLWAD